MALEFLFGPLIILLIFALIGLAIFLFIFWIFMIVDCAKRDFKNDGDKIAWILIVVILQVIGAAIYYFVIFLPGKKSSKKRK
jgi:hypothetical protein